ncbi:hypothetical protein HDU96_009243 [Phlyctochytrium bullatum]|nr:hypothetical protein HDU96_009243 [Phlyctochytrium bullatum]
MAHITFTKGVQEAYEDVLNEASATNWVLFGYDKNSNDLKLNASGDGGLKELVEEWEDTKIQYAFCRVLEPISKLPKFVLMSWCGDGVPVSKKGLLNSHLNDVVRYFKAFHVQINARSEDDIEPGLVMKKVQASSGAKYGIHQEKAPKAPEVIAPVGSVYQPVRTAPKSLNETTSVTAYSSPTASAPPPEPAYRNPAAEIQQLRRAEEERRASATTTAPTPTSARPSYGGPAPPARPSVGGGGGSAAAAEIQRLREAEQRRAEEEEQARERERAEAERRARESEVRQREARDREERERQEREERARREAEERQREEAERIRKQREEEERRQEEERAAAAAAAASARAAPPAPEIDTSSEGQLTAIALYAYQAQEENEIDFDENEVITGIEKLDEGWWQGVNAKGRMGLFPANYVQIQEAPPKAAAPVDDVPAVPDEAPGDYHEAVALYDYEAAEENEISFAAGDKVTHIVFVSEEWWQGRVNGVDGLFPGNYVELTNA